MSDITSSGLDEKGQDEKLGAFIRRARLAAKIDLNDLARKIRISPEVLQHIEESKWDSFPVEAYVRGYLNSICIHLELDRNKVLGWFGNEYRSDYVMPVSSALRDVGVVQNTASSNNNSKLIPALIVILIVVFFVVMNLLRNSEKPSADAPVVEDTVPALTAEQPEADTVDTTSDSSLAMLATDSVKDSVVVPEPDTTTLAPPKKSTVAGKETSIRLECLRDSVWIRIERAGQPTRSYQLKEGRPRYFSHNDTIKVRIAGPERTRLYIENERVRFKDRQDLTIFNGKLIRAE